MITTLYGNKNDQMLELSKMQIYQLHQIDSGQMNEVGATMKIQFIAPINVIDEKASIQIYLDNSDEANEVQMDMKGCYDTEAHYAYFINEALNKNKSELKFSYDNEVLLRQKRYHMIVDKPNGSHIKSIVINDIKLAYILGMDYEQIGQQVLFENYKNEKKILKFSKKMFILLHHELNIYCTGLNVPNYVGQRFEQTKDGNKIKNIKMEQMQHLVVKTPYMFQPGSYCEVQGNYQLFFDVNQLIRGISLDFRGEYGNQIDFEGSRYSVQLQCFPSERVGIQKQLLDQTVQTQTQLRIQSQQEKEAREKQAYRQEMQSKQQFEKLYEQGKYIAEEIGKNKSQMQEIEEKVSQLQQLEQDLDKEQKQTSKQMQQIIDDREQLEEKNKENLELQQKLNKKDKKYQQLKEELDETKQNYEQYEQEVDVYEKEVKKYNAEKDKEYQELEEKFNKIKQEKEKINEAYKLMEAKYKKLAENVVDGTATIYYINQERKRHNEKYGTKLRQINENSASLNKILGVNADKEKEYHQEWQKIDKTATDNYNKLVERIINGEEEDINKLFKEKVNDKYLKARQQKILLEIRAIRKDNKEQTEEFIKEQQINYLTEEMLEQENKIIQNEKDYRRTQNEQKDDEGDE